MKEKERCNFSAPRRGCFALRNRGQATLALVFLIGGIIVVVGVSLAFIVTSFIISGYGFQSSNRALAVAAAGVDDAIIKLIRNKNFSAVSPYDVPVGDYTAKVSVIQNLPASGQVTIISTAAVAVYKRKIQAVVAVDPGTGQVQLLSWDQLTL
jgi:uncharacterized protein (UPF0333 family)